MATYVDNHQEIRKLIVEAVNRAIEAKIVPTLNGRSDGLMRDDDLSSWDGGGYVHFRAPDDQYRECGDLHVSMEHVDQAGRSWAEDSAGNMWSIKRLEFKVNWACYGSTQADLAFARASQIMSVTRLAVNLQEQFKNVLVYKLERTRAEIDAQAEAARKVRFEKELLSLVPKGLRVKGNAKPLLLPDPAYSFKNGDVPRADENPGAFTVSSQDEKKAFCFWRRPYDGTVMVERIS